MIHLLFLVASLGLVILGQKLLLLNLPKLHSWNLRCSLQMLGLAMPLSVMVFFTLTMLPSIFTPQLQHMADYNTHQEWLLNIIGFFIFSVPVMVALLLNLLRLVWLYRRVYRRTWEAPAGLAELVQTSEIKVRLWHSTRSFAFNLPTSLSGTKGVVVLSTAIVGQLDQAEIRAVLWHEISHLARRDFWIIWLANWWYEAFFYLPQERKFLQLLKDEQELACDERVAKLGGQPLALALADALLKVWEESVGLANQVQRKGIRGFRAPGLASNEEISLTEQRVTRLIEFSSSAPLEEKKNLIVRLKAGGLLGGSLGLWLMLLELIHMVMLPLGCAISLGII